MQVAEIRRPKPHPGQKLVLASKARRKVLLCGRRWGKSVVAMISAMDMLFNKDGSKVIYVTPEYSLAKVFYNELLERIPKAAIKSSNVSDLEIKLKNKSEIKFFSGEAINNIRGREADLAIVDEAAMVPDLNYVWNSVIKPMLTTRKGSSLFISTPRGMNYFYAMYLKGKDKIEGFESWQFSSDTNPYFPKDEFDEAKATTPEEQFKEEYLAEPMANQLNPFGNHVDKNVVTELSDKPTILYGIDVASVKDWTVIIGLDEDGKMSYFDRFKVSWPQTKKRIRELPHDILKVMDSTGAGKPVFQDLVADGTPNIFGFDFTNASKAKIIFALIGSIENGDITYNEVTARELKSFEQLRTPNGGFKFEAQKGFHDDCVCALALANYFRVTAAYNQGSKISFISFD